MTVRNVCFTINNYTVDDIIGVCEIDWTYLNVGWEVGEKGTPHMQGYGELARVTRFNTLKKSMPRAHLGSRKKSQKQADEYCKKEGFYTTHGTLKRQGARNDLCKVREAALEGGMREVSSWANLQGIRVAEKFLTYNEEPRNWECDVHWLWGPTGTGKSRTARELCNGSEDIYTKNTGTKWWDGYDAHEYVIIDDFRPSWWDITYMLSLLDRYEFRVETKGGHRQFRPKTIIVTSCLPPERCYLGTGEAIQQLLRRVSVVSEVGGVILEGPPTTTHYGLDDLLG